MKIPNLLYLLAALVPCGVATPVPADLPSQIRPLLDASNFPPTTTLNTHGLNPISSSLFIPPSLSRYILPKSALFSSNSKRSPKKTPSRARDLELIDDVNALLDSKRAAPPGSKAMNGALCGTVCHISYQGCLKVRDFLPNSATIHPVMCAPQ